MPGLPPRPAPRRPAPPFHTPPADMAGSCGRRRAPPRARLSGIAGQGSKSYSAKDLPARPPSVRSARQE